MELEIKINCWLRFKLIFNFDFNFCQTGAKVAFGNDHRIVKWLCVLRT